MYRYFPGFLFASGFNTPPLRGGFGQLKYWFVRVLNPHKIHTSQNDDTSWLCREVRHSISMQNG
jgi:hypothetical protein